MNSKRRTLWSRMFAADAPAAGPLPAAPVGLASSMRPLALEQRFMFDGAAAVDVAHAAVDAGAHAADAQAEAPLHALMAEAATSAAPAPRSEVVFIDSAVKDYAQIVASVLPGTEVVLLDASRDGVQQIAQYLQGRSGIDAIHIVSHGADGQVRLGASSLEQSNLSSYAAELAAIGAGLTADGDILLYGCNIAADAQGQSFLAALAGATGADVAASSNATGAQALGGDWVLERQSGHIEAALPFDAQRVAGYGELLVSPSNGVTSFGPGVPGSFDVALSTGAGNVGVTALNVADTGWDISVKTTAAGEIGIGIGSSYQIDGNNVYYTNIDGQVSPLESFKVSSNNGFVFDLQGMLLFLEANAVNSQVKLQVTGYRNGVAVAGAAKEFTFAVDSVHQALQTISVLDNSNFQGIDSFVITQTSGAEVGVLLIDNIDVQNVRAASTPTGLYSGGPVATSPTITGGTTNQQRTVVGDFNNDGIDDILYQTAGDNTPWQFAQGNENGSFTIKSLADSPFAGLTLPNGASGNNFQAGDFNGDGYVDLLASASNGTASVILYRNTGSGFVAEPQAGGPKYGVRTLVGDFNGDGFADILYQSDQVNSPWFIRVSNGDGTFRELALGDAASPFRNVSLPSLDNLNYHVADVDGDGYTDLIYANGSQLLRYFHNDAGVMREMTLPGMPVPGFSTMVAADFDGDGDADILFQNSLSEYRYARNDNGTFSVMAATDANSPFRAVTLTGLLRYYRAGDFDGDGDIDLFTSNANSAGSVFLQGGGRPQLVSATPADNSASVAPTANITLTFDQGVSKGTGNIQIVRTSDGAVVQTIAVGSSAVTGSGTTWTIDPPADLAQGTGYSVRIDAKSFVSADGRTYKGIADNATLNFTTSSVLPPVIANLNGDAVTYVEDSAYVLLDAGGNAVVTDADSAHFNGGKLTVQITTGLSSGEDALFIRDQGAGANQIVVSGASILYNGLVIGTFTGGTNGNPLVVTFTANANPTTVSALVQNLAYRNSNTIEPSITPRTVSISMDDGAGGSSTVATVGIEVHPVNDTPVVNLTATNPTYTENTSAVQLFSGATINTIESGQSVVQMVFTVSGIANGAAEKLVIDGTDVTLVQGTSLSTSINGILVSVSVSSGIATVTLDKAAGFSTATAQTILNAMAYRNDSESPNTANRVVTLSTVSDNGGTADGGQPTSTVGITSTVTVVGINDAPVLFGGPYNFAPINENTTAAGVQISTVLANFSMVDPDVGALRGVAVTGKTGNGTWQYSTDNMTWTDFGGVANTSALLLSATTYVRYVPDGANGETATLIFRGWDQTTGSASANGIRSLADTSSNGGTTAFSTGTGQANLTVTAVNDAPVITPVSPMLTGLTDTSTANAGDLVSALTGGITDVDNGAVKGIAITGLTATYGKWQFTTNAGTTWTDIGVVSNSAALILRPSDRIRFVPDGIHGETATITYKAWDQTNGTAGFQGAKINTTTSGGTSAFSTDTDTASVVVAAVNDRPVVTVSGSAAVWTEANNAPSTRIVVDSAVTVSDADGPNPLSATVRLLTYYSAQDTLAFANDGLTMGNIAGTWNAATGILTLSSAGNQATTAQFQAAMRAVTYGNSSENPNTTSRTVQFQLTDGGGLASIAVTRDITIVAVNDSPTISAAPLQQVNEDIPTAIGNITFSDVDSTLGVVTFSVGTGTLGATGAGGVTVGGTATALTLSGTLGNINNFIANNRLVYTPAANASGDVTLTINVNTTSVSDATTTMTLRVVPVNDAPVATVPPSITVTEDVASVLTGISFTDVDAGTNAVTATFSVPSGTLQATSGMGVTVDGSGSGLLTLSGSLADINFFIAANGLSFKTAQDATASVLLTVTVNDRGNSGTGGEQTSTKTVTLNVTAVNDAPVNTVPGAQTVGQGLSMAFNTANGNAISISDVDAGNGLITVTLTAVNGVLTLGSLSGINMVSGTGLNNATMIFEGNRTNINAALQSLSFRGSNGYIGAASITIETNDNANSGTGGAKSDVDTVSINVIPVNPKVTSVSAATPDGVVKIGDEVLINMVFDQAVNVDLTSGIPTLLLETGLVDRNAVYQSGSGSNTLVFKYTVQAGDTSADLDFQSTAALQLNGAVISNNTSDFAVLTLPTVGGADSLGGRSGIVVDGVVPVVGSVAVPFNHTYVAGNPLDFTVNFSEAVTLDTTGGTPRLAVTLDTGGTVYASYVSGSGSSALVFRMTVASGQLDADGIGVGSSLELNGGRITDLAGNAAEVTLNGVGATTGVRIDAIAPGATITLDDTALRAGETAQVTIAFNEAVLGLDLADFDVTGGALSSLASADGGKTWTATFTPNANIEQAVNTITLRSGGVIDAAGNANGVAVSGNYAVDTRLPTASIMVEDTALRLGETSLVTITFSEAVTGLTNAALSVANGSLTPVSSSDGGITWTATFTPNANVTDTTNLITLDNTGVADLAGNAGTGVSTSDNYAIDTQRPTATIVVADEALRIGESSLVTITFSEAVTGFTNADLTVANGTLTDVQSSDGGITWTATFTPTSDVTDATNLIVLDNTGVADLAGNAGSGISTSNNYAVDTQRPTATIMVSDNALAAGETSLVTITFSEAVTGFSNADLTVANGTLTDVQSSDGGKTWTATFTPTSDVTDATNLIMLDNTGVADLAGNAGSGTTDSNNYAIDTLRPTASIVIADAALRLGETSLVTITFSEAVTGFSNADLTVANGTLTEVQSSDGGITWTAMFTPNANVTDTTNLITLDNTGVADLAGNAGTGVSTSDNYAIDTQRPTATIVVADDALRIGESSLVTITFSEAVTGFTNADLTVANGTLTDVQSSDGGITWTATFTPTSDVTDATNLIVLDNTGVADLAGNAGSGISTSNNYAVDTQRPTATIMVSDNALAAGETSLVTITFSEAVTGFSNADLTVANGTLTDVSSSDGGITWTATFTPTSDVTDATNLITLDNTGVADLAGNAGSGTTESNNYAIDTLRPTASIVIADAALRLGETSLVTITFSEAVSGLTNADLTVANGTLTEVQSSDGGITWTATFTPSANVTDTTNLITLDNTGVADLAGNAGTGTTDSNSYAIDTQRPTASIVVADNALAAGETSLVTITFSEAVTGFSNADLTVAKGTLTDVQSSDGGKTWTATFTPASDVTDAINLITLDNTGVADLAGNAGTGTTHSNNYAIDTLRPTATITVADTALRAGETTEVTIAFSEVVAGLALAHFDVASGSLSDLVTRDGGLTWTARFTPGADVEQAGNAITLRSGAVSDAAGNAIDGATPSNGYTIDTRLPTARITVADDALKTGETAEVTIVFSERVQGLDLGDFTVAHGTLSDLRTQDGITWTATLTPDDGVQAADNRIVLNNAGYTDLAGNGGLGLTPSQSIAIDTQLPTASIVLQDGELLAGMTTEVTIVFSEPVQGLDLSDFTVPNGTLSDLRTQDGITWKATLTPANDVQANSNLIRLNNAGYSDLAGNTGVGETGSDSYAVATAPVPSANAAPAPIVLPVAAGLASVQLSPAQGEATSSDFGFLSPANDNALLSPLSSPLALALAGFSELPLATRETVSPETAQQAAQAPYVPQPIPRTAGAPEGLQLLRSVNDLSIGEGGQLAWKVPANVFGHTNPLAVVSLSMTLADGRPLPQWVRFDARTGTLQVQLPEGWRGDLVLQLTARDNQGNEVKTTVKLKPGAQAAARAGLAEQFQRAALQRAGGAAGQRLQG